MRYSSCKTTGACLHNSMETGVYCAKSTQSFLWVPSNKHIIIMLCKCCQWSRSSADIYCGDIFFGEGWGADCEIKISLEWKHFVSLFSLFCASSFNPSAAASQRWEGRDPPEAEPPHGTMFSLGGVSETPQQTEPNKSSGGVGWGGGGRPN